MSIFDRLTCRVFGHKWTQTWQGPTEGGQRQVIEECRRCADRFLWVEFDPPITLQPGESYTFGISLDRP